MKKIISVLLAFLLCVTVMLPACAAANNDGAGGTIGVSVQQKAGGVTDFFAKVKAFFENIIQTIRAWFHVRQDNKPIDWNDSIGTIHEDLSYGELPANRFDLYLPANCVKDHYGLIVYLHAGGFTSGDKHDDADILKRFCAKGYVAAGINYTLRTDDNPEVSVYTQSLEIRNSIPSVVNEAARLGYPLDKMIICGGSAGATLAMLYAYRDAEFSPIPVKAVIALSGPSSFHHEDWTSYGLDKNPEAAAALFSVMSGNEITAKMIEANDYDDMVRDISAYMWVNENSVPTLCAYGKKDVICPFASARHLVKALEDNNVPHDYIEFPHSGHALMLDPICQEQLMEKMSYYLETYLSD